MNRPIFQPMNGDAIMEIIDAVKQIVEKHHGEGKDTARMVDYSAVATLALLDMGLHHLPRAQREIEYDKFAGNIKRMCRRMAEQGLRGILGGTPH